MKLYNKSIRYHTFYALRSMILLILLSGFGQRGFSQFDKSTATTYQVIKLTVQPADGSSCQETVIRATPQASDGYDFAYDGKFAAGYAPLFYSQVDLKSLSTNTLSCFTNGSLISLAFGALSTATSYYIELTTNTSPVTVWIKDKKTGTTQNLSSNSKYYFTGYTSDNISRFQIFFTGAKDAVLYGAVDKAANYNYSWTNGSGQGNGFSVWTFTTGGTGTTVFLTGNPTVAGITGMSDTSFTLNAYPSGTGTYANAKRSFVTPMPMGSTLSFDWGINLDCGSSTGSKGFCLYSGGIQIINVKNTNDAGITINNNTLFGTGTYGTQKISFTFTYQSAGSLRVTASGRNGGSYNQVFEIWGAPDAIMFYASDIAGNSPERQPYFGNFNLTTSTSEVASTSNTLVKGKVLLNDNITTNNLTIIQNHTLQINPGTQVNVNGTITNYASVSGLIIASNATGTGSLIHNTANVQGTIQRYMEASDWVTTDDGWHMISSPVAGQTIGGDWVTTGTDNNYDFYSWDESTGEWVNFKDPGFSSFNGGTSFILGRGYLTAYQQTDTKEFTGNINIGNITINNLTSSVAGNPLHYGFNLLGNPFASSLEWGGWTSSNINSIAKIWNESSKSYSDLNGGNAIPVGNGFLVEVADGQTGSITIPSSKRIHSTQPFYKNSDPAIRLIAFPADESSAQETIIRTCSDAENDYDFQNDARFARGGAPLFYTIAGDEKLSTNTLNNISNETVIPAGFAPLSNKSHYKIKLSENSVAEEVWLLDIKTDTIQNLSNNPVYAFDASVNDAPDRFRIFFSPTAIKNSHSINIFANQNAIHLRGIPSAGTLQLFDLNGHLILEQQVPDNYSYDHTVNVTPALYVIRFIGVHDTYLAKVLIL